MENQEQNAIAVTTLNNQRYEELANACKLLGRYLLLNDTLSAFMGPLHSKISMSTEIVDKVNDKGVTIKQPTLRIVCTRYNEDDTPEVNVIDYDM